MENLFGNYQIHEDAGLYLLEANVDFKNNTFYMPALTFRDKKDPEHPKFDLTWDHPDYLIKLYNTLKVWTLNPNSLHEEDKQFLEEIRETIPEEDFNLIYSMLEKAMEIGFFN
jgi:hypothetical protein